LLKPLAWTDSLRAEYGALEPIYGNARGAFLVKSSLKVATLSGPAEWGLYPIELLREQPEVRFANSIDPDLAFFMDASNVWYYGLKQGQLWCFDAATDELDSCGPVEQALEALIGKWEIAVNSA